MVKITGYIETDVYALIAKMTSIKDKKKLSNVDIAYNIKASSQSVDTAFRTFLSEKEGKFKIKASDRIVCKVCSYLGINLAIVETGEKKYYINSKK